MELITQHICKGLDMGVNDNMFGGSLLALLDSAGAAYAMCKTKTKSLVTLKMEETIFHRPVKNGDIVIISGEVTRKGNTSITLKLEAVDHDVVTGEEELVCSTSIVFVRVGVNGKAMPIRWPEKEEPVTV